MESFYQSNQLSDEMDELHRVFMIICSSYIPESEYITNIHFLNKNNCFTVENILAFTQNILKRTNAIITNYLSQITI